MTTESMPGVSTHPVPRATSAPLQILTVCTGNLCRSPLAAQLLRSRLTGIAGVTIRSAGTHARDDDPMHPLAAGWSQRLGGDPSTHRSTYLTTRTIGQPDLVLAMARQHRSQVVRLRPATTKVTFTLREFARLAEPLSDADLRSAVDDASTKGHRDRLSRLLVLLASRRGQTLPADPGIDDVVDPIGGEPNLFAESAREIEQASVQVLRVLRLALRRPLVGH